MDWLPELIECERLPVSYAADVRRVWAPLADDLAAAARTRPGLIVGLCAPQASGKTTLCAVLERLLQARGVRAATLALDDLYLRRADREALARDVHPLLITRGPPGTHDAALGCALLDALQRPGEVAMPVFDKTGDDRAAAPRRLQGPYDVVLFEGWCVGAIPQPPEALQRPVNALERGEDPDGGWRGFVNATLAGAYRALFGRIDRLVLLRPPGFEVVLGWRTEQERRRGGVLTDAELARFVAHYERLTRWILEEAPARADLLVALDRERRPTRRR